MKAYKHIAILLLISFSAFLGHNLVPHHHYAEAFLNPLATNCPVEHSDHHSCDQDAEKENHPSEDHPTHCHAFNDVVFKKHNTQNVLPFSGFTLVLSVSHTDLITDPPVLGDFYCFNGQKVPLRTIELYGSRDLRGPPVTA